MTARIFNPVLEVLAPIQRAFYSQGLQLFLVGGSVRDMLMGNTPKDLDLATDALPEQTSKIMESIGAYIVDKLGGSFGTVHTVYQSQPIEITTFRANEAYTQGDRRPTCTFSTSLSDDLKRRDFTCNAIAANVHDLSYKGGTWYLDIVDDPTSNWGRTDITNKIIATPISPEVSFTDDPLRMLRAYRFYVQLGFQLNINIRPAIKQMSHLLRKVSWERIYSELTQILAKGGSHTEDVLRMMMEDGVLGYIFPELTAQIGFDQDNYYHHLPLWEHTLAVVQYAADLGGDPQTLLACLLHDVTKPTTWQACYQCTTCGTKFRAPNASNDLKLACSKLGICNGSMVYVNKSFKGHDHTGALKAEDICDRLKTSNAVASDVALMIEEHQNWSRQEFDVKSARKFVNKFGDLYPSMLVLLRADRLGHAPGHNNTTPYDHLEELISQLDTRQLMDIKPPIDGFAVMAALGMKSGPELGVIMKALQEATIEGTVTTKDEALQFVMDLNKTPTTI